MSKKTALITGITGQDGAYLAHFLLNKGYEVHGIKRRASLINNTQRIDHIYEDPHIENKSLFLHYGDMTDATNILRIIQLSQPDEIYNLAAQSHVKVSFEAPEYTANTDAIGPVRMLEAIRILGLENKTRFYQASTSELYGKVQETPQKETTPFYPRSPYGVAKLYAYWIAVNYREAYDMFAVNGILFNHESPLRGETFVTRKITRAAAKVSLGMQTCTYLGNLDAKRDWGHTREFVEGMWHILNAEIPEDYVLATGTTTSVREFTKLSFNYAGIELEFEGQNEKEIGRCKASGKVVVRVDPEYYRPTEVDLLQGDGTKAKENLDWAPKIPVETLCHEMVEADLYRSRQAKGEHLNDGIPVEALLHHKEGFLGWMKEKGVETYAK